MALLALNVELELGDFRLSIDDRVELEGITALFGPSGSGKSTLLRIIAGLETRARGQLSFDDENWQQGRRRVPACRRGATLLFQDLRLFTHLDVAGNLAYASRRAPASRPGPGREEVIRALELGPLLPRRVASLSGGEAQRVAIARALLSRPRLLLMDEPLASLDLDRRARLLAQIETLPDRFGIPVLYVTHAIEEVVRLAQRTVLMSNGRWTAHGDTSAIVERLDLPVLSGGAVTGALLRAAVTGHHAEFALTQLRVGRQQLHVPALDLPVGSQVRLRVRARDVALAITRPQATSIRNILGATILNIDVEPDSPEAEVLLDVDGHHLRARVTRASVSELRLGTGMPVFALIKSVALEDQFGGT